jgi:hypothetical protein
MGSYNVTCIVSKTPIFEGEDCRLIVFNNSKEFQAHMNGWDSRMSFLWRHFLGSFKGKYNDYGRIDTPKAYEVDMEDGGAAFFISEDAWQEMLKMAESKDHKQSANHQVYIAELMVKMHEMTKKAGVEDDESDEQLKEAKIVVANKETVKVICMIDMFASLNNFNAFDSHPNNFYGGQCMHYAAKDVFQELRQKRIDSRRKKDKKVYGKEWNKMKKWA